MESPLDSARLKCKRANVHIVSLDASVGRASRNPDVTLSRKGKLNIPDGLGNIAVEKPDIYALSVDPAIRLTWVQIIGDILSNLRASLDHIAWALATRRSEKTGIPLKSSEERKVTFPIRLEKAHTPYRTGVGLFRSDVQFFPDDTWDVIKNFQPYNRRDRPKTELLGILDELVSKDKHRVVAPVMREVSYRLTGDGPFTRARLNQPYEYLFLVDASMGDKLKPEISFDLILHVPFIFPDPFPVSRFREIHGFVRDEVIPAFTSFF